MPLDRDATLKQAEKLLRQGKLDGAIAEYVRLIEDQPRDWNSINALGDLYVRAGDTDRAVAQFTQVADYLFGEGFFPKAQALYKKALKVKGDHEHTLLRISEIAAQQGLLADARQYLRQLGRQRRDRGDSKGAADCLIRLASLEEADAETKIAGARAAQAIGDTALSKSFLTDAAELLETEGKKPDAVAALAEAAALDPADTGLRSRLAREYVAAGDLEHAKPFLTRDSAGADPDLLLALGQMELSGGNVAEARSVFTRFITIAPSRWEAILAAAAGARAASVDAAFSCVEVVVEDALLAGDWDRGIDALQAFVEQGAYIPAFVKLIELAVDSGHDDLMHAVQPKLADAYIEAARGAEARVIAEDLVSREPHSEAHVARLRRALDLVGVADADSIIARYRDDTAGIETIDLTGLDLESDEPEGPPLRARSVPPNAASQHAEADLPVRLPPPEKPAPATAESEDDAIVLDLLEIDLTEALAGMGAASPVLPPPPVSPAEEPPTPPPALESVFEEIRAKVSREQQGNEGAEQYERALQLLEQGRLAEAIADLQGAARAPQFRFKAASRLGRLHIARGETDAGIEWLERAAEAPAPSPDEGHSVLYDLASALEKGGESARALAIFMEIDADGVNYRDVRARIDQLTRTQAGSPRP